MNLFTEEKLRNSMNSVRYYVEHYDESVIDKIIDNHVKALSPIELPTDEEIAEIALLRTGNINEQISFINGAMCILQLIEGGSK
jgi:hypothetical protein